MNNAPLDVDHLADRFADVAESIAEGVGGTPTLGEFLEVVGWSVPSDLPYPFEVAATVNGRRYVPADASRVPELADDVFADARSALADLPADPDAVAEVLTLVLAAGRVPLADLDPARLRRLTPVTKRAARPKPGDLLAIPVSDGYRVAVVITRNRFGTALGLFDGVTSDGRAHARVLAAPRRFPVYTEESLVKSGRWRVVGHDEGLLALFPDSPEVYHEPGSPVTGEFGAAESADGRLRLVDRDEAVAAGLSAGGLGAGTYRQTMPGARLQTVLTDESALTDESGPTDESGS
ncbi:hypothetical protein [Saccharothrix violaceirubra]|uniref:Uncharacterized protein n=1 Tax=Saccharothrix violaceirubra TaxID=413306 RepID=A0A7W7T4H5_9PSEU|nr:hypothetical protein [Saccharothrix violaceirubra]MBB4966413.1 hypothetical protein [Saccharothrix violaceirubra]